MYPVEHRDLRRLADDLVVIAAKHGHELTPRPWNRFEPDDTDWWLVPGGEWPAHKYGKLFLHWSDRAKAAARADLHVEKGLGQAVQAAYDAPRGRRRIMDEEWAWHHLLASMQDERLARALAAAAESARGPLRVTVQGGYVADPDSFDPYAYDFKQDRYEFIVRSQVGELDLRTARTAAGLLEPLDVVDSVQGLRSALTEMSANPWLWLDLMAGVQLRLGQSVADEPELATPADLWRQLDHFGLWLRTASA